MRKGLIVFGVLGLLVLGAVMSIYWASEHHPLAFLPSPEHGLQAERTALSPQAHRHVEHIALHGNTLGDISFTISLPNPLPAQKLPIVLVMAGHVTSAASMGYIKDAGDNVIVGYAWPLPVRLHGIGDFMMQAPDLYHRLMTIPGQVASALRWLSEQPWADSERLSLLGFSQGALAVPAVQDIAAQDGIHIGWTIIAYGGAPLGTLLAANPHMKPPWLRHALAPLVDLVFHSLEPTVHLPRLSGKFLVLEGQNDTLIPERASKLMRETVPQPKTVITFEGDHMGVDPGKMALLQRIIEASEKWLIDNGAINRP
jgi:Serine hydrolase (FSH1)